MIGYNAQNLLLPGNQTLASDVEWHREMSASQWQSLSPCVSPAVAPIPAFVSNASYDGMFYVASEVYSVVSDIIACFRFVL